MLPPSGPTGFLEADFWAGLAGALHTNGRIVVAVGTVFVVSGHLLGPGSLIGWESLIQFQIELQDINSRFSEYPKLPALSVFG